MAFHYSPYAMPLFAASALALGLAVYALRRRQPEEALTFGFLMLGIALWTFFLGFNISGSNLETQLFFNRLKYLGVSIVPPLWLILALQYTNRDTLLSRRRNVLLIFLPGLLGLLVVLSDAWTHWWWPEVWLDEFNGYPALGRTHGLIYNLSTVVHYLYVLSGLLLYIDFYRRAQSVYRLQAGLMVGAALFPLVASIVYHVGYQPLPWGMDAFAFSLTGLIMAAAIFRYSFLDIVPVARRMVVEQMPDGVLVVSAQGRVVDTNPAALALLEVREGEDLVGRKLLEVVDSPRLQDAFTRWLATEKNDNYAQDVYVRGYPEEKVLSLNVTTLSGQQDKTLGNVILIKDITERVAVQRELEELYQEAEQARERLALIISTASDAIVLLGQPGEILAMNPAARKILRTEVYADFPETLKTWLRDAQQTSDVSTLEVGIHQQSFHVSAVPVAEMGLVFTMHDVTHFKDLAQMKDEFVSTVSHDLRSPLTSIIGYASIAQRPSTSEESRAQALKRIEVSAQRMTQLIEDLLSLATIEAGVPPVMERVCIDRLAREAIEDLEGAALRKGLTIIPKLAPVPPVIGNPKMLAQAWHNLLSNSIKYTPGGTIIVSTAALDHHVQGVVEDTGIGIPPADLPYIFDKFYRVKNEKTDEIAGTGLGLALVKSIVEIHNGQVWVDSMLDRGSTFGFRLPKSRQASLHRQVIG
ncbi:MAG: histidine kinase N-terminal 7TM domain-containing protein [Anaerolineales bacterium]